MPRTTAYTHRLLDLEPCEAGFRVTYSGKPLAVWEDFARALEQFKLLVRHPEWIGEWIERGETSEQTA